MGTVVKNIPDNKRILYYCMIPYESNMPMLELLSSQHTAEMFTDLVDLFMCDARFVNNGVTVKTQYVIMDLSYAVMKASLRAFENCDLACYLQPMMHVLQRKLFACRIRQYTFLCLSVAHMLKCMSCALVQLAP